MLSKQNVCKVGLKDNLTAEVAATFSEQWQSQDARTVPDPISLRLNSNHAKDLETATVLYADIDGSTDLVDRYRWEFSAEVYKAYLRCASQIIRNEGGAITAYDGDRVMAVFTGDSKNTSAVRCALKINYAVCEIIQPALRRQYTSANFVLSHVVGVDTSRLRAARIGVHGDNDIVWIGRAANYAAKLTSLSGHSSWITETVYNAMHRDVKFSKGRAMWERRLWTAMNNHPIYCSTYWWRLS